MNDQERERRAIRLLEAAGDRVIRQVGGVRDGWWIVLRGDQEIASMDNLAALVELAEAVASAERKITPSA